MVDIRKPIKHSTYILEEISKATVVDHCNTVLKEITLPEDSHVRVTAITVLNLIYISSFIENLEYKLET